jgi:hypothetical protein
VSTNVTVPSVEVKAVDALVVAGSVPLPIAPLAEPVTSNAVAELKTTAMVCGTAAEASSSVPSDELLGFVLGEAASAAPPSAPLAEPVTVKAVAELNWTVSVSETVASTALLIEPLFDVLGDCRRPEASTVSPLEAPLGLANGKTCW